MLFVILYTSIAKGPGQGCRQDFAKGGADTRREMPTPFRAEVLGLREGLGANRGP